jgi:hypothetical protein
MFIGISMISILLSLINNSFYRRRIEKVEIDKKEREMKYLKDLVISKLSDREKTIRMFRVS